MAVPIRAIPGLETGVPVQFPVVAYAADGAVTLVAGGVAVLSKGGVGAYTLAAPASDGCILHLTASTAHAHVVTIPTAAAAGGAGQDVLTFGGAINDSVSLVSYSGLWGILSTRNVTAG